MNDPALALYKTHHRKPLKLPVLTVVYATLACAHRRNKVVNLQLIQPVSRKAA